MKILIVDDSRFSQITTSKLMGNLFENIEIFVAGDGEEGWEKYQELGPDYIFIDLLMPKIDGQTLVKMIKEDNEDAKIFVVSADVQHSVRADMEAYGVKAFINKPFTAEKAQMVADLIKEDENDN